MLLLIRRTQGPIFAGNIPLGRPPARSVLLLLGVLLAGLLVWAAPSAYADQREIDEDDIRMTSQGFDFGDGSFTAGAPLGSGRVEWLVDENQLTPHLIGDLHLNNVDDECARMRMDYYTDSGSFWLTRYGTVHCADDNGHHDWDISMSPYTHSVLGKVKVTLEHQLNNGTWASIGSEWSRLGTYVDDDNLLIPDYGTGLSFGGSGWNYASWQAGGSGQVEWEFSEGQIRPHVTGTLHADNAAGECARMRIDYYADDGELPNGDNSSYYDYLHTVYGGEVCANDNSYQAWSVDRRDWSDHRIRQVSLALERRNGSGNWTTVSNTVSMFGT